MQVTFLKDHVNHKAGDTDHLNDDLANYLVRTNVAAPSTEKVEQVTIPEKESNATIPGKVEIPVQKEKAEKVHKREKHSR